MQVLQLSFSGSIARAGLSKKRQKKPQRRVTALMIIRGWTAAEREISKC